MRLNFEYGEGTLSAELPDSTDVFIPGESEADPECLPQDWESLYGATMESIRNPVGMPPLADLATPDSEVTIVTPDIVKGGCQETSHRKVSVRACIVGKNMILSSLECPLISIMERAWVQTQSR